MASGDSLIQLLNVANRGDEQARSRLLARLWEIYFDIAYRQMKARRPKDGSDVAASGFREFAKDLDAGKIHAHDRRHLMGILKRVMFDKLSDYAQKDKRRAAIVEVRPEADVLSPAQGDEEDGLDQWAQVRLDSHAEFESLTKELFEIISDGNLQPVLAAMLDVRDDRRRSNNAIARELKLTPKEVATRRKEIQQQLKLRCGWIRELGNELGL